MNWKYHKETLKILGWLVVWLAVAAFVAAAAVTCIVLLIKLAAVWPLLPFVGWPLFIMGAIYALAYCSVAESYEDAARWDALIESSLAQIPKAETDEDH